MMAKTQRTQERIGTEERFVGVGAPAPMTTAKLVECNDNHDDVDAGREAVFAVAHRQGVVQNDADEREREAMNVLYLTADGTRACERWYLGAGPEDFREVDRAFPADEPELEPAGENARRFAPIVREHPEVEG